MQVTRVRGLAGATVGDIGFWLVALAPVPAVLAVPVLVLEDGGLHLASAAALQHLLEGRFPDVLTWRPGVPPNLTVEIVLLGLLQVLPPMWALKVVVAAVLLGFALVARRLVVAGGAAAAWATVLLPFAWHRPLAMGFLGFSTAVVLALLAIALVLERPARPPVGALAALLAVTWFTHLVPALAATAVCGAVVVLGVVGERRRALAGVVLAASPVLLLTAAFVLVNPPGRPAPQSGSVLRRAVSVLGLMKATVSTVRIEYAVYGVVAAVLYVCAAAVIVARLRDDRSARPVDALLLAAAGGAVVAVLAPEGASTGGSYLGMRVALLPALLLAAWVAIHLGRPGAPSARPGAAAATVLGMLSLLLVVVRLPAMNRYSALATEILELAPCVPEYSTVLQVNLDDFGSAAGQTHPLSSQVAVVVALRRGVEVGNESGWVPFYLWRFRDDQNPERMLSTEPGGVAVDPPRIDLAGALRRGERIDAVVVVGRPDADPSVLADGPTVQLLADLEAGYGRAAVSSRGASELWLSDAVASACR